MKEFEGDEKHRKHKMWNRKSMEQITSTLKWGKSMRDGK